MHKENVRFYRVEAEEVNAVSEKFDISAVPEWLKIESASVNFILGKRS